MAELLPFEEIFGRWVSHAERGLIERYYVSFDAALAAGDDQLNILSYVAGLGFEVRSLEGLAAAIERLEDEEELSAEWSAEGLVIRHASDGWLALFTP